MAIRDNLRSGGSSKKLYEALQYSGLVTEDMTFDEMCEVLAAEYPERYIASYSAYFHKPTTNGTHSCDITIYYNDGSIAHTESIAGNTNNYEDSNISIKWGELAANRWTFTAKAAGTIEVEGVANNGTDFGGTSKQKVPYTNNTECTIVFTLE